MRERWLVGLTIAALLVRLHWNLVVHPVGDYVYSDMRGYVQRSEELIEHPWAANRYHAFFPYGTHYLVAAMRLLFGKDNFVAVSIVYALMGTALVALVYLVARRMSRFTWVPPLAGLVCVFYYPLISLGGYVLSEIPAALGMMLATWFLLRLVDEGKASDAWLAGTTLAFGAMCRPQWMLSAALFGVFWLVNRRHLQRITPGHLLRMAIPVLLLMAGSSVRMWHNSRELGVFSRNGSFNMLFGRCHTNKIEARASESAKQGIHFRPPEFIQLNEIERKNPQGDVRLDPIIDEVTYVGDIGDSKIHNHYIKECIRKGGWLKQLQFSAQHIVLLWKHNVPWPDSGKKEWRGVAKWWQTLHKDALAIPTLLALCFVFLPRRTLKPGIAALHVWAMLLLAALYFGGARHRAAYDPIVLPLAAEVYAYVSFGLLRVGEWLAVRLGIPLPGNRE